MGSNVEWHGIPVVVDARLSAGEFYLVDNRYAKFTPMTEPTCICDHELTIHNFDAGGSWCEKVVRVNSDGEHEWCSCWRFHDVNDSDSQDNRGEYAL